MTIESEGRVTPKRPSLRIGCAIVWYYASTSLIVGLGVLFGRYCLSDSRHRDFFDSPHDGDPIACCANWDGRWYEEIAQVGYRYDPEKMSSVAFYPTFPLVGRGVIGLTGMRSDLALTLVSNMFFLGALGILFLYTEHRFPDEAAELPAYTVLALALLPTSFFFRVAYSDSLFLFLAVVSLYGLERQWPLLLVAILIGLATATRAVGIALAPPLLLALWSRYPDMTSRVKMGLVLLPVSVWGLAAYLAYQYTEFGNAFALSQTQEHWCFREKPTVDTHVLGLLTLEPFWSVYVPSSPAFWRRHDYHLGPLFSLQFANPLYFAGTGLIAAYGALRGLLRANEVLYVGGVLLIPYLTKSYEGCMNSHGRYAAVAFPVYIVLGRLLCQAGPQVAAVALALSGVFMGIYAAFFAAWFLFI